MDPEEKIKALLAGTEYTSGDSDSADDVDALLAGVTYPGDRKDRPAEPPAYDESKEDIIDGVPESEARNYAMLGAANPFNVLNLAARSDTLRGLAGGEDVSADAVEAAIARDADRGGIEYALGQSAAETLATAAAPGGGAVRGVAQAAGESAVSELNRRGWGTENLDEAAKAALLSSGATGAMRAGAGTLRGAADVVAKKLGKRLPAVIPTAPPKLDMDAAAARVREAVSADPYRLMSTGAGRARGMDPLAALDFAESAMTGAGAARTMGKAAAAGAASRAPLAASTAARNVIESTGAHETATEKPWLGEGLQQFGRAMVTTPVAHAQYLEAMPQVSPSDDPAPVMRGAMLEAVDSPALEPYPGLQARLGGMLSGWLTGDEPSDSDVALMAYRLSTVPGLDWSALEPENEDENGNE